MRSNICKPLHAYLHHFLVCLNASKHQTTAGVNSLHSFNQLLQQNSNGRMCAREIQTALKAKAVAPRRRNNKNGSIDRQATGGSNLALPLQWELLNPVPGDYLASGLEVSGTQHGGKRGASALGDTSIALKS